MAEEKSLDEQLSEVNAQITDALRNKNVPAGEKQRLAEQAIKLLGRKSRGV